MFEGTFPGTLLWLAFNRTSEVGYGSILFDKFYVIGRQALPDW